MFSHHRVGKEGEKLARHFLERRGYEIIIMNWRHHHLEIDIVAQKNNILHIVEVKTQRATTAGFPEESVDYGKFINLQRAAEAFMNQFPHWSLLQFDIVSITLGKSEPAILFIEDIYY